MTGFLDQMASSSRARVVAAKRQEPLLAIEARAAATPPGPRLQLDGRFDVIAELKLRSPALGTLGSATDDWLGRVKGYAVAGAAAVSVLTEPSRFDGALEHLKVAAAALAPLGVPTMRKDFLVDAYQLYEARANGAGGVLLIVRMLEPSRLGELLDLAADLGLFVLLEAFDADDVAVASRLLETRPVHPLAPVLVGINSRDLQSLEVVPERLLELAATLPQSRPRVAESGLQDAADCVQMARAGYDVALVGGALMSAENPTALLREMLVAGRNAG